MPWRMDMGSKLPMQPLSLGARPGREDLMLQVTKRGLDNGSQRPGTQGYGTTRNVLLVVRKGRGDGRAACEGTVQGVEGMETMFWGAGLVLSCCQTLRGVDGEEGHGGKGRDLPRTTLTYRTQGSSCTPSYLGNLHSSNDQVTVEIKMIADL